MNTPNLILKVVVSLHFILSVWGSMSEFMPVSYIYVSAVVLACGLWAIGSPESIDAIIMMLVTLGFSVLQDIILLALYEPRAHDRFERDGMPQDMVNEYRFALGMSILNLLFKPMTGFILFRLYLSRSNETAFNIPGIDRIPGLGGMGSAGGYENIDNRPTAPYSGVPVETAAPHATVAKE